MPAPTVTIQPKTATYEVRSHIKMNMELEKVVCNTFVSLLAMMEHAEDDQPVTLNLLLGELRQHVQWCQYAALSVDNANATQQHINRMSLKMGRMQRMIALFEEMDVMVTGIGGMMDNMTDRMKKFKDRRLEVKEILKHAKTNN